VEEELEPIPRFYLQAITNRFGDRCLPFTTERSFHKTTFSSLYILSEVKIKKKTFLGRWTGGPIMK
jgi:hypothetical protein